MGIIEEILRQPAVPAWFRVKLEDQHGYWEFVYCWFFTAKSGTVITSFQGLTLMFATVLVNMYLEHDGSRVMRAIHYVALTLYVLTMTGGFMIGLIGTYVERSPFVRSGSFLVGLGLGLYLIFSVLSFIPNKNIRTAVCISERCSDFHWLVDVGWRETMFGNYSPKTYDFERVSPTPFPLPNFTESYLARHVPRPMQHYHDDDDDEEEDDEDDAEDLEGFAYVLLSILHILFISGWLLYSLLTYLGYYRHLVRAGR